MPVYVYDDVCGHHTRIRVRSSRNSPGEHGPNSVQLQYFTCLLLLQRPLRKISLFWRNVCLDSRYMMCGITLGKCVRLQHNSWLNSGFTFLVLRACGLASGGRRLSWSTMGAGWTRTGSRGAASSSDGKPVPELELEDLRVGLGLDI